ncbi:respiratory-chain NADH dehydrogenase domain-containing protein [Melioribacter roseus P3M-2]|uniref:Respiratory-chain NADH dehydrogenase domain-containing protein n=1 Tax=Melioribacter roseus (strain DSM 23840 / JCM 17771 / VKM B-2668 / P3M-2) TaxID=1191523 RepID=I6ZUL3_MELRP|nr:4Fe-4S dicluster domain-containing protein [Melioribacter roseus]AFN75704.1 respiratory-chain NADH dehydrogenase domain-containing protein [Melioribacter roseus P3M-2]
MYNISNATEEIPVTKKFLSVTGAVKNPKSFFVPVGTSFRELIELAGGTALQDYGIFVSGILMGRLTFDIDEPVTKTTAGIIVLPINHYLIDRMKRPIHDMNRIGKSACDQCSYCTEFCPRYLLGYDVQPHKVMRSLAFTKTGERVWNQYADLCCSCGLCSLYACPEDLYPREACNQGKDYLRKNGIRYEQPKEVKVHPMKEGRRAPLKMLMKKLQLTDYDKATPFEEIDYQPRRVKLLLKQHAGQPAKPVVVLNQKVRKDELVADVEPDKVGAKIHASIDGVIKEITDNYIIIEN